MRYEIVFTETSKGHYRSLDARWRATVKEAIEAHLRYEPMKTSRSRIKRLREMAHPEYRLLVDRYRVFYDVTSDAVEVLAIVPKDNTVEWLNEYGVKSS